MLFFILTYLSTFFAVLHIVTVLLLKKSDKRISMVKEKGISLVIPCYNEAPILKFTIEGLSQIKYKNFDVIFVNDGSTDKTYQVLNKLLKLKKVEGTEEEIYVSTTHLNVYVMNKPNEGKALSLNKGILFSKKEIILTLDADSVLHPDALSIINQTFYDKDVIACGGSVHVMQVHKSNKKRNTLIQLQMLDLLKGFYIYKSSLAYHQALAIISGAFGAFKREVLVEIGGFRKGLGEDIDVTLRLQEYAIKHQKKIEYRPQAYCYTECPERWRDLIKQRVRWQKGFIDSLLKNRSFLFNYAMKKSVCFFIIFDALLSNTVAIFLLCLNAILIAFNLVNGVSTSLWFYVGSTILMSILYSMLAIYKAEIKMKPVEFVQLIFYTLVEAVLFRMLNILFFIYGTITYPMNHDSWNKFERTQNQYVYKNMELT